MGAGPAGLGIDVNTAQLCNAVAGRRACLVYPAALTAPPIRSLATARYVNTTACHSRVSYIDGDRGILRYRGYPIEQLAEQSNFLEVCVWGGGDRLGRGRRQGGRSAPPLLSTAADCA